MPALYWLMSAMTLVLGCEGAEREVKPDAEERDADGDGYDASSDCDDNNAITNPGAVEVCDGLDNNCNGDIDENSTDAT